MIEGEGRIFTARIDRIRRHQMWFACSFLIACISSESVAQELRQQLLPSRTQSRHSILSAASPTTVLEEQRSAEQTSDSALQATAKAPANTQALEELNSTQSPLPEGYVQTDNQPELPLDAGELAARMADNDTLPGLRIGTLTLRPTISQGINSERETQGDRTTTRSYLATSARGTLESDWSRHSLRVTGDARFERNLSGSELVEKPELTVDSDLRLDLGYDIQAHILGGYRIKKEDATSPNAILGVRSQATEHSWNIGGSAAKEFGTLRTLAAFDVSRKTYSDATALSGASISLSDRDRTEAMLRGRIGYELSPALIPFLEITGGVTNYDDKTNFEGYQRSSRTVGAKIGTEFDRGEKLSGEFALGYLTRDYDDRKFGTIDALSIDALAKWSPQRGTDVNLALRTTLDDFANGNVGGWANYQIRAGLTHQLRSNLIGRLSGKIEYRDAQNVTEYVAGAGITWSVNRYLDVTADVAYKVTPRYDTDNLTIGAGISLKR